MLSINMHAAVRRRLQHTGSSGAGQVQLWPASDLLWFPTLIRQNTKLTETTTSHCSKKYKTHLVRGKQPSKKAPHITVLAINIKHLPEIKMHFFTQENKRGL